MINLKGHRIKILNFDLLFDPKKDITTYELAIIITLFKVPINEEGIKLWEECLEDENIGRHFIKNDFKIKKKENKFISWLIKSVPFVKVLVK